MSHGAAAETRAECEAGIAFIQQSIERAAGPAQREVLTKALQDAERELGEGEFEECLEAVEDAKEEMEKAPE